MLILDLNLIPPERKTKLKNLVRVLFIKNMLEITAITAAIIATILLWGWLELINNFTYMSQSAASIGHSYSNYNQEIRDVNRLIKGADIASADFAALTPKLLELIKNLPAAIKINSLDIDRGENQITLSGTALTRADLLDYQSALKNISWLEPASIPTSQLLQKDNINFTFQTKITGLPALNAPAAKR